MVADLRSSAAFRGWPLSVLAVTADHVRVVAAAPEAVLTDRLLRVFKSYASRELNRSHPRPANGTWWAASGSRRRLPSAAARTGRQVGLDKHPLEVGQFVAAGHGGNPFRRRVYELRPPVRQNPGDDDPLVPGDVRDKLPGNQQGESGITGPADLRQKWSALEHRWESDLASLTPDPGPRRVEPGRRRRHDHRQRRRAARPGKSTARPGPSSPVRSSCTVGPTTWFRSPTPRSWRGTAQRR